MCWWCTSAIAVACIFAYCVANCNVRSCGVGCCGISGCGFGSCDVAAAADIAVFYVLKHYFYSPPFLSFSTSLPQQALRRESVPVV